MHARPLHCTAALAVLACLAGFTLSCGRQADSDIPLTGPAYVLTTEGADDDVHDVLLQVLQSRMKPVRVVGADEEDVVRLGTIHVAMRVSETRFESSDRTEKVGIPRHLRATVTVLSFDGSCNWDGEHSVGFETDPPVSFSDSAKTRRRYARRLLEVAVKQLPGRGVFKHDSLSTAQPPK
ncbi:MAG: hypothetical protein ACYTGW_02470 [Planctomycetota bacterium]|jgi:hypothetical protein